MDGFFAFWNTALVIAIASIPLATVGLTFLHAARTPQWVWAMSGKTQIWWLAGLLIGVPVMPIGIPAAIYYLVKIRPVLGRIETGNLD